MSQGESLAVFRAADVWRIVSNFMQHLTASDDVRTERRDSLSYFVARRVPLSHGEPLAVFRAADVRAIFRVFRPILSTRPWLFFINRIFSRTWEKAKIKSVKQRHRTRSSKKLANEIKGRVSSVDDSGRLVSDISIDQVADTPRDESTIVRFGDHETVGLHPAEHDQPPSTMVACLGKSGFIEIEIVGVSLSDMLGIKVGEPVTIKW